MSLLQEFLKLELSSPLLKIGVVGDAMIDEYFNVRVKKISPEFPIPVMHSDTDISEDFPGGAANVVYQFKNFNVNVNLISFIDSAASVSLQSKGINVDACINIPTYIPRKKRFYSDDFPTYRWDVEKSNYGLNSDLENKCFDLYSKVHKKSDFDVLIFSDYDKGVFHKYLNLLISECPITIIDPKSGDLDRWRGCTIFKPNKQEALTLSGCTNVNDAGIYLLNRLGCKAVIITQSGEGVSVFDREGIYEVRPTEKLPPAESVIGAGDCFTAFLAMAVGWGMSIRQASEIAWRAGVLYVRNRHNKPISKLDLCNSYDPTIGKINIFPDNNRDYKLVFTNGCFDILHAGHIEMLKFAKSLGDKLVVAVNSDESISQLKPGRPFVSLNDRMKMLASLEFVDFVVSFGDLTPLNIIKQIMPDVLVKGDQYKKEDIVGYGIVKEIVTAPMISGLSTTNIIQKIKAQQN